MTFPIISILVPTRNRPNNVLRFLNSVFDTATFKDQIEVLFYVDEDDNTFPTDFKHSDKVSVIRGKRIWISLAWNLLYVKSKGDILMYAGDDVIFETPGWDERVKNAFKSFPDSLGLVYGNDGGWYSGKLAINGFIHRRWANVLGYFAYPARLSALDLWIHECASFINRVIYLEDVMIRHVHYRQGTADANFDNTYQEAYEKSVKWGILETYNSLARERRIDKIMLSRSIGRKIPIEPNYLLGHCIQLISKLIRKENLGQDKVLTFSNRQILERFLRKSLRRNQNILRMLK